mgnify:CR=1 FL=1
MKTIISVVDYVEVLRTTGKGDKVVATLHGQEAGRKYPKKFSCWEESNLLPAIKNAWTSHATIEVDYETKESGMNPNTKKPYTNHTIVGVGGGTKQSESTHSAAFPAPLPPTFNGQEVGCIINNACNLIGTTKMSGDKLPTQEDILSMALTIWKANNAFKLKITEGETRLGKNDSFAKSPPSAPHPTPPSNHSPIEEEQEIPNY